MLTNSEMLDSALRIYQANGWAFLRITAVPTLFCLASIAFLGQYFPQLFTTTHGEDILGQVGDTAWACAVAALVAVPLFLMGFSYAAGIVVQMTSDYLHGVTPDAEWAIQRVNAKIGRLFALVTLETLISSSGLLVSGLLVLASGVRAATTRQDDASAGLVVVLAVIAGVVGVLVYVGVRISHSLAIPAVLIENLRPTAAGKRSRILIRGVRGRGAVQGSVESVYVLIGLIWFLVAVSCSTIYGLFGLEARITSITDGTIFQPIILQAISLVPTFVVLWFTTPLWASAITLAYYDRRIRVEGYDIEALAGEVARANC